MNNNVSAAILLTMAAAGAGIILMVCAVERASGAPACMTKAEARTVWPRSHIYWHGPGHCWDNRAGGGRRYAARAEAEGRAPVAKENKKKVDPPPPTSPTIIYPALKPSTAFVPDWLNAFAATTWPSIMDIDDGPDLAAGKDGCCWPKLDQLMKDVWERKQ